MALLESTLYQVDGGDIELVSFVSNDMDSNVELVLLDAVSIKLAILATHDGNTPEDSAFR
jgi:hypothetical protein